MMGCKVDSLGEIKYLIVINESDWHYKDGYPFKIKRKYGKFDRADACLKLTPDQYKNLDQ